MSHTKEAKAAKKAAAKNLKKEKQLFKAQKKLLKDRTGDFDQECDIQKILNELNSKKKNVIVPLETPGKLIVSEQPSPRAACTLTPLPTGEYLLFGGEFYDGGSVAVYDETYRWNIDKNEWRKVESIISPPPRCSHQTVAFKDHVYVFGGEYATVSQFYHFRDLWRFDIKQNSWSEVKCTGIGPSARSGHRMVVYKNYIVVFGGFHDTLRETKYYNDLFLLSLQTLRWSKITIPAYAEAPSPRSGVMLACYPQKESIFMCGGYIKVKDTSKNAQGKSLRDAWLLNMKQVIVDMDAKAVSTNVWERLNKKAYVPSARSGSCMVTHKSIAILFGGVLDVDEGGTSLQSIFYNDLHAFDLEKKRWFLIKIQGSKIKKEKTSKNETINKQYNSQFNSSLATPDEDDVQMTYDSDEDNTTFGYIDQEGKLVRIKITDYDEPENDDTVKVGEPPISDHAKKFDKVPLSVHASKLSESLNSSDAPEYFDSQKCVDGLADSSPRKATNVIEKTDIDTQPDIMSKLVQESNYPLPRLNALLVTHGNDLIVYGGIVEVGSRDLTLDDCWRLNLNTREKWVCILKGHLNDHPWTAEDNEESSEDENKENSESHSLTDSGSSSSSSSSSSKSDSDFSISEDESTSKKKRFNLIQIKKKINRMKIEDDDNTPTMTETLREFFDRTKSHWIKLYQEKLHNDVKRVDEKEMKRGAFELASRRYSEVENFNLKIRKWTEYQQSQMPH